MLGEVIGRGGGQGREGGRQGVRVMMMVMEGGGVCACDDEELG